MRLLEQDMPPPDTKKLTVHSDAISLYYDNTTFINFFITRR